VSERGSDARFTVEAAYEIIHLWQANPEHVVAGLPQFAAASVRERLHLPVTVRWNPRFTALAGRCNARDALIELSPNHEWAAQPHEWQNMIVHEYAHFLVGNLEGRWKHGPMWRRVHMNMGGNGMRCHDLPLLPYVPRRSQRKIWMRCEEWCAAWHRAQSAVTRAIRFFRCGKCGGRLVRTNERGAVRCWRRVS